MNLWRQDCGCPRFRWRHDLDCLWNVPVIEDEEVYDQDDDG